jgi:hypothetical protein
MLVSDPNSTDDFAFVDTGSTSSSAIMSGSSSGGFDFGGLITSLAGDATAIIKSTSSPQPITVRPGTSYINAQGQLVNVPSQSSSTTLIMVGIGLLIAFLLIKRLA